MNPRHLLLALSLVANAILLGAYLMAPAAPTRGQKTAGAKAVTVSRSASGTPAATTDASSNPAKAAATTILNGGFSWSAIETDDLDELLRRLKAVGFTPREIRIIMGDVILRRGRYPDTGDAAKTKPYWRATWGAGVTDAKAQDEQRKRNIENGRLYRKYILGPDSLADDPDQLDSARRRWGDLPLDKLQALTTIDADYDDLQTKQRVEQRTRPGEESNEMSMYRLMEKERMADIAKVLTPEEFDAFELRSSLTANQLRYRLEGFNATEEEYKAIYAINKPYQDRLFDLRLGADAGKALQAEIAAKVKDVLGADRALDYDAVMNYNNQDQTGLLVSRLGLPARVAVEIRQTQQDLTQQAKDIRANTGLPLNERNTQLAALAQQAESQLTTKLGANGYEAYSDLKGDWIRALQPKGP